MSQCFLWVCVCLQECVFACMCLSDRIQAPGTPGEEAKIPHGPRRNLPFAETMIPFWLICGGQTASLYFHRMSSYQTQLKPNWAEEIWFPGRMFSFYMSARLEAMESQASVFCLTNGHLKLAEPIILRPGAPLLNTWLEQTIKEQRTNKELNKSSPLSLFSLSHWQREDNHAFNPVSVIWRLCCSNFSFPEKRKKHRVTKFNIAVYISNNCHVFCAILYYYFLWSQSCCCAVE